MASVEQSVLVGYPAQQMYSLVDDIERYPEFLPWCAGARVETRDGRSTRATILIDYRGIKQSFMTENRTHPAERIEIHLVSGPFRKLEGLWLFTPLAPDACKIQFRLHYEFSNRLLEKLVGPVFRHIAGTLLDAFLQRAEQLHRR